MISENFNLKKFLKEPAALLRIFLGFVFLTAGIFRIFNPDLAVLEFTALKLPVFLSGLTVFLEIGAGLGLLFNKGVRVIYWLLLAFISFALIWALAISGKELFLASGELFIFNLTPTDWLLHFFFLLVMIVLLAGYAGKNRD